MQRIFYATKRIECWPAKLLTEDVLETGNLIQVYRNLVEIDDSLVEPDHIVYGDVAQREAMASNTI
jgi:hypothetical protein